MWSWMRQDLFVRDCALKSLILILDGVFVLAGLDTNPLQVFYLAVREALQRLHCPQDYKSLEQHCSDDVKEMRQDAQQTRGMGWHDQSGGK